MDYFSKIRFSEKLEKNPGEYVGINLLWIVTEELAYLLPFCLLSNILSMALRGQCSLGFISTPSHSFK